MTDHVDVYRRRLIAAAGCTFVVLAAPAALAETDEDVASKLVERLTGRVPVPSGRVRLTMPRVFPNGYTVPLDVAVDSPMTDADHVMSVRVLAPKNPLVEVATFRFVPGRSRPRISTRIRLAKPQFVAAVADMNDGTLLMAQTWVEVATNGCE